MRRTSRISFVAAFVAAFAMLTMNFAFADVLYVNQLTTGGSSTTTAQGGSGSLEVWLDEANGTVQGDSNGCGSGGAGSNNAAYVTLSSNNAGVTITNAGPRAFAGCGIANKLTFTYNVSSTATGTAVISGSITGGKDDAEFNTTDSFTVNISASTPIDPCAGRVAPGAPTIAEVNPPDTTTGWYKIGSPDATFAISPATNAEYKIGNGSWTAYTDEVTLNTDAQHSIIARNFLSATTSPACTRVDGTESAAKVMKVDRTAPGGSPADVTNTTWRNSSLSETFTFSDSTSGLAPNQGLTTTDQFTVTASAESASVTSPTIASKTVTDIAGNSVTRFVSALIDLTGPAAPTATLDPAPNGAGWNNVNVTVSFGANGDNLSGVANCTANSVVSTEAAGQTVTGTCTDNAGNTSTTTTATVNLDKTVPTISDLGPTASATGQNGWYLTAVTNNFRAADTLSGFPSSLTNPWSVTTTTEGSAVTVSSGTVSDKAGNPATAINSTAFKIDLNNPTVTCNTAPTFVLGSIGSVTGTVADTTDGSGPVSTTTSATADTSSIGSKSITLTGTDNAGRQGTQSCGYSVVYNWTGFFQPIDSGTVLNKVKAGSAVPVKFSLNGDQGLGIIDSIRSMKVTCSATAPVDLVETLASGTTSGLKYDSLSDQYNYTWKTSTTLAGTCQRLELRLADGSLHTALFNFVK